MMGPLIDDQLLAKTIDPDDNRSFTLSLTEAGKQAVLEMSDDYFKPMNALRDGLGKKKFNKLIDLLDQANEVLVGADD